jgi:hypothetical protein
MTTRKKRIERTEENIERVLTGLEEGRTLTKICEDDGMPSLSAIQKWARNDNDLDEAVLRARVRGMMVQYDEAMDAQRRVMAGDSPDPKILQAVATVARDVKHSAVAMLTRLDQRFSDKRQVENIGSNPVIIGWDYGGDRGIENIDRRDDPLQIAVPDATGGDARKH